MKLISEHLGEVIAALVGIVVIICCVGVFHAPIGDFFTSVTNKLLVAEDGAGGSGGGDIDAEQGASITFIVAVDGTEVSGDSKTINYDGNSHVVTITCEPKTTIKYKVNGVDVVGTLSFKAPGSYVINYTAKGVSKTFTFVIGSTGSTGYTNEEIENSPYLMAIGRTDPLYVVAEFNEDFSSVKISKNGTYSDGIMREFGVDMNNSRSSEFSNMETTVTKSGVPLKVAETLTSAVIEDGVVRIGREVFSGCSLLTNIEIPDSVTSIGIGAFSDTGISTIEIPGSVKNIETNAFAACEKLTNITIPNNVKVLGNGMFNSCLGTFTVVFPEGLTEVPGNTFEWCNSSNATGTEYLVTERITVEIPAGVTSIGAKAFKDVGSVLNVTIPKSVTTIGDYAFYNSYCVYVQYDGTKSEWNAIKKGVNWNKEVSTTFYVTCSDGKVFY